MAAGQLALGDQLFTVEGRWVPLQERGEAAEVVTVYNFRVAEYAAYFVGGDAWEFAVWPHNITKARKFLTEPRTQRSGVSGDTAAAYSAALRARLGPEELPCRSNMRWGVRPERHPMNGCGVDWSRVTPWAQLKGEDEEDTVALRQMLDEATAYIQSFSWQQAIRERYFGYGIGGVLALFLFQFEKPISGTDDCLWVVVGDLPSAYFVVEAARGPAEALQVYCELMNGWADAVLNSRAANEAFPINVPATAENAEMLKSRIRFIREQVIPEVQ